eukprot:3958543-Amphidinium_carterae.1
MSWIAANKGDPNLSPVSMLKQFVRFNVVLHPRTCGGLMTSLAASSATTVPCRACLGGSENGWHPALSLHRHKTLKSVRSLQDHWMPSDLAHTPNTKPFSPAVPLQSSRSTYEISDLPTWMFPKYSKLFHIA